MVSGRGLGHTGGTLDKLESIPGFKTQLPPERMRAQLASIGVIMVGQGTDLAPADGKLYALRDVTSTVENESFIVSSIVSKKIAEGAGAIVYDVKCGNGAFMKSRETASHLAQRLVETTRSLGRRAAALVTDMNQPLGAAAGNALEVVESAEVLRGRGPEDVRSLTLELSAIMLERSGAEGSLEGARTRAREALESGAAWEKFLAMIEAQGGDPGSVVRADGLPRAPVIAEVKSPRAGAVAAIDTFGLGELVVRIGGGRAAKEDAIDPRVGLIVLKRLGDAVERGEPLARIHLAAEDRAAIEYAAARFTIAEAADAAPPLVIERVG
jgi:pyrimidine-nucleoside phosphorylase